MVRFSKFCMRLHAFFHCSRQLFCKYSQIYLLFDWTAARRRGRATISRFILDRKFFLADSKVLHLYWNGTVACVTETVCIFFRRSSISSTVDSWRAVGTLHSPKNVRIDAQRSRIWPTFSYTVVFVYEQWSIFEELKGKPSFRTLKISKKGTKTEFLNGKPFVNNEVKPFKSKKMSGRWRWTSQIGF